MRESTAATRRTESTQTTSSKNLQKETITTKKRKQFFRTFTNVVCTAYTTLVFFLLWIPAFFCSSISNKITNFFGWDIKKSFTSIFMRGSSRIAVKLNPFWTVKSKSTNKAPEANGRMVFVCNHQSHLDPVLINSVFRFNVKWVSVDSMFRVPFGKLINLDIILIYTEGGYMMHHCGDIMISFSSAAQEDTTTVKESAKDCMSKCREWLELDVPIFLFPEGRRSRDGSILEFKKGAFILAKQNNAKIVPCAIHGTMDIWPVGSKLLGPGKCVFVVGDVLDSTDFKDVEELTSFSREKVMELQKVAIEEYANI